MILQPFDLVKTRLQQDNALRASEKRSIPHIFKKIWIEEGKLGLWKGTGATLARQVFYSTLTFLYHVFRDLVL